MCLLGHIVQDHSVIVSECFFCYPNAAFFFFVPTFHIIEVVPYNGSPSWPRGFFKDVWNLPRMDFWVIENNCKQSCTAVNIVNHMGIEMWSKAWSS